MENTEIAQSPANEAEQLLNYWSAAVMVIYQEGDQQASWMCNTTVTNKNGYMNVRGLLETQALAQEHFLKAYPSMTPDKIVNTVILGMCNLGWMTSEQYLDASTKKMLDEQLAAVKADGNVGSN